MKALERIMICLAAFVLILSSVCINFTHGNQFLQDKEGDAGRAPYTRETSSEKKTPTDMQGREERKPISLSLHINTDDTSVTDLSGYNFQALIFLRQQIDSQLIKLAMSVNSSQDGFVYVSNGSEVRINQYEGSNPIVIVPSEIDGLPVTQFHQNAFKGNIIITSVTLPEGTTEIPQEFFKDCTSLKNVYLPNSVTRIGRSAFLHDTKLDSIILHEGIIEIEDAAFQRCEHLKGVAILPTSLMNFGGFVFSRCDNMSGAIIQSNITVGDYSFSNHSMKFIYVKDGCNVSFEKTPFDDGLEVAILPETVTNIGDNVFDECNKLRIVCPAGSYAEMYAKQHFIMCDTEHYSQFVQDYDDSLVTDISGYSFQDLVNLREKIDSQLVKTALNTN